MIRSFSSNLIFRIVLLAVLLLAFAFFLQKNDAFWRVSAVAGFGHFDDAKSFSFGE
jgi:hypothetical protein